MAKAVPIPIPLNGLNTISPDLPIEAGFARELTNYWLINGRLRMRPAVEKISYSSNASDGIVWFDKTQTNLVIDWDGDIRNISTGAVLGNIGALPTNTAIYCKHVNLELVFGLWTPRDANFPFTDWTFTKLNPATLATTACSYKGRLFVCDGSTIEYSNVGQVTGTMYDSFDVSEFMEGQEVVSILPLSTQSGNSQEVLFVILGEDGKVLIYQGDYPASSTWNLVGNYDMPPVTRNNIVQIEGNIWVSSNRYAYWVSGLVSGGTTTAFANSPSKAINNIWEQSTWDVATRGDPESSSTFYSTHLNAILCQPEFSPVGQGVTGNYGPSGVRGSNIYVFFREYNAWSLWVTSGFFYPFREFDQYSFRGCDYFGHIKSISNRTSVQVAEDDVYDSTTVDITTSWKTAFINAFRGNVQKVVGVRPYFLSSINGYLEKIRLIFDYSDYNSSYGFYTQPTVTQINPGNYADGTVDVPTTTWDNYSPFSSVSGAGGGLSLQITQQRKSGSADVQLNEIYSATVYVEDGGEMI